MNTQPTKSNQTLDDLIFEDRNQTYGAYNLRSTYNARIKKAFALSISTFVLTIFLVSQFAFNEIRQDVLIPDSDSIVVCPYQIPPPDEAESPQVATSKVTPPVSENIIPVIEEEKKPKTPAENPNPVLETILNQNTEGSGTTPTVNPGSQTTNTPKPGEPTETISLVRVWVDEMPEFFGGEAALRRFIVTNFRVPNDVEENIKIRVFFVVDEQGKITDITIEKGESDLLNREAIRVLNMMPNWKPGKMGGRAVKVRYFIPIVIKLQ